MYEVILHNYANGRDFKKQIKAQSFNHAYQLAIEQFQHGRIAVKAVMLA